jgi:hypothetical protein
MTTESYVSARPRAIAIQILVGVQLAMIVLTAVGWGFEAFAGESEIGDAIDQLVALTCRSQQMLYWAAFIVFMTWVHRSIANLPALGSMSCRFTPSGASWSFVIPFVNLVRGYQVAATIWSESQPALVDERGVARRKTSLVNWWWGLFIAQIVISGIVADMTLFSPHAHAVGLVGLGVLRLAVGVMFLVVVTATQRRQDAMWDDLQRQGSVPKPTAQYLR